MTRPIFPPAPRKWYSRFLPKIPSNVAAALLVVSVIIGIVVSCIGGYVANIVKLVHMTNATEHMGEFIVRIIGLVLVPLGIFMGWFIG